MNHYRNQSVGFIFYFLKIQKKPAFKIQASRQYFKRIYKTFIKQQNRLSPVLSMRGPPPKNRTSRY